MLVASHIVKTPSVERLVKLWAERYAVNLFSLSLEDPSFYGEFVAASSPEGRALTAAKLRDSLVNTKCQMAGIQAKSLYEYIPNIVDLNEARRLTQFAYQIYQKLLEIYQQQSYTAVSPTARLMALRGYSKRVSHSLWGIPDIEQLATAIEPALLEFQEQHVVLKDWRTLGFITTQFNFSNNLLLHKFTPIEKVLLGPYFKFVEEQVAIPWQRVCAAAAKHQLDSPALTLVEQMFPAASEIAETVYRRLTQLFPNYLSRRGSLSEPCVAHSCIRDLNMFQAYLWLCVLESSMAAVEQELVTLCVMVMQGVGVPWEMTEQWSQLLVNEIESRVEPKQKLLLLPYTKGMEQAFFNRRKCLGATPNQE